MHYFKFAPHIKKDLNPTNWYLFNNYKIIQTPILLIKINSTNMNEFSLPFENLIKTST